MLSKCRRFLVVFFSVIILAISQTGYSAILGAGEDGSAGPFKKVVIIGGVGASLLGSIMFYKYLSP